MELIKKYIVLVVVLGGFIFPRATTIYTKANTNSIIEITEFKRFNYYMNRKNVNIGIDIINPIFGFNIPKEIKNDVKILLEVEIDYTTCTFLLPLFGCMNESGIKNMTLSANNNIQYPYKTNPLADYKYLVINFVGETTNLVKNISATPLDVMDTKDLNELETVYSHYFYINESWSNYIKVIRLKYENYEGEIIDQPTNTVVQEQNPNIDENMEFIKKIIDNIKKFFEWCELNQDIIIFTFISIILLYIFSIMLPIILSLIPMIISIIKMMIAILILPFKILNSIFSTFNKIGVKK